MISKCLNINDIGNLTIGGEDTVKLAEQYGTPLIVYDEQTVRESMRSFKKSVESYYNGNGMVLYASKAFSCKEIYRIANSENIGIDVVSAGELYTALSVGFPAENVFFHGNNKTPDELLYAVKNDVGHIVVDNINELKTLNHIASQQDKTMKIMLRIKPGVDAHTHDFVKTGQIDSKFGFAIETGEAIDAALAAAKMPNLDFCGLHCHIGSQIFDAEPFCLAADIMLRLMKEIENQTGIILGKLNLGGGFGIKYTESDTPCEYDTFMKNIAAILKQKSVELDFPMPQIFIEPGRSSVASAAITLYTVGAVKNIPNVRTYVSVDGGMADNPRYALYGAKYDILIANKAGKQRDFLATIAGKCCESGDLLAENTLIQNPDVGDILAVTATGAYNYSMASNYNRIPRPAVIMVDDNKSRVIIKRESLEDISKNDL